MPFKTVSSIITPTKSYQYNDTGEPMRGGMKDVYFSPDKSYVIGWYRNKQDFQSKERLKRIVTEYYDAFFKSQGGQYYEGLYCWPTDVVGEGDRIGVVVPAYKDNFFFQQGYANNDLIKGKEKQGKWFASAKFRAVGAKSRLDSHELGDWLSYFQICVNITRGVKRLHAAGLAHSDLSYSNVLIDPVTKSAAIIDIDGLVVPSLFPPDVIGTADFIAPEVLATKSLKKDDPKRKLPNRLTDLHALAVLIYMYLLYRHPLRGGNYFGPIETEQEEDLLMGEKALFIEHPTNKANQNFKREYGDDLIKLSPYTDIRKTPYTITGPYLKKLFDDAFVTALHNPALRPMASQWEEALLKTTDLMQPCSNPRCEQKWYVFDNSTYPKCPFCNTPHVGSLPILDLYYRQNPTSTAWRQENHRLMVYNNQYLMQWHANKNLIRNERLTADQKTPVGYFTFHQNRWVFVNQKLTTMKDVTEDKVVPIGQMVELTSGKKLLLSNEDGGRLVIITIANT